MIHVTPQMAAIGHAALAWYAELLSRRQDEFTALDFPTVSERTVEGYISQLRQGWCDIRVVRRGKPTVYGLPLPSAPAAAIAADTSAAAAAFAAAWAARPEAVTAPCSASDYQSLRSYLPGDVQPDRFERALTSKLIELSGSDLPAQARPARRLAWLRVGVERSLAAMAPAGPAAASANTQPHIPGMPLPLDPPDKAPRATHEATPEQKRLFYANAKIGPQPLRYPPDRPEELTYL
jgi:hypothetical protein